MIRPYLQPWPMLISTRLELVLQAHPKALEHVLGITEQEPDGTSAGQMRELLKSLE